MDEAQHLLEDVIRDSPSVKVLRRPAGERYSLERFGVAFDYGRGCRSQRRGPRCRPHRRWLDRGRKEGGREAHDRRTQARPEEAHACFPTAATGAWMCRRGREKGGGRISACHGEMDTHTAGDSAATHRSECSVATSGLDELELQSRSYGQPRALSQQQVAMRTLSRHSDGTGKHTHIEHG